MRLSEVTGGNALFTALAARQAGVCAGQVTQFARQKRFQGEATGGSRAYDTASLPVRFFPV